jgi:hypothetical protein
MRLDRKRRKRLKLRLKSDNGDINKALLEFISLKEIISINNK